MAQVALNLNLTPHLLLDTIVTLQFSLVQYLERANETASPFAREVHTAEFTLAEWPPNVKHAEVKCARLTRVEERHGRGR